MLSINTNIASLIAQNSMKTSTDKLNQAIERMTTGLKINHASDNAANYSISTNMTTKIGAYMVAEENAAMGLDLLATANDTLDIIDDRLSRLRMLQEQVMNGTYDEASLKAINAEVNALTDEIERLYKTTEYNGMKLFDKEIAPVSYEFYGEVTKVDTIGMTKLSEVNENEELALGEYIIETAEDLAKLSRISHNAGVEAGCTFVLANDIDLKAYKKDGGWNPISYIGDCTFNGNGHVIKNLYIDRPDMANAGLFSDFSGEIFNLGLENVYINGNDCVGALTGLGWDLSIDNCYATGTVIGYDIIGGLVGECNSNIFVDNSYTACDIVATVESDAYVGGFFGYVEDELYIYSSYTLSSVSGNGHIGGFVGFMQGYSELNSVYNGGKIKGTGYLGSLFGSVADMQYIQNAYSTVDPQYLTGGYIGNNTIVDGVYGKSYYLGKLGIGVAGDGSEDDPDCDNSISCSELEIKINADGEFEIVNYKRNLFDATAMSTVNPSEMLSYGTYSISTANDLQKFIDMSSNGLVEEGCTFALANDIDMSGVNDWRPGTNAIVGIKFEGNGYKIKNLTGETGLFNTLEDSVINNLKLENVNISTRKYYVGAICSSAKNTKFNYCEVSGNISAEQCVGGVVGEVYSSDINETIFTGQISASVYVGGIAGSVSGTTSTNITNVEVNANIEGENSVGGIVGNNDGNLNIYHCTYDGNLDSDEEDSGGGIIGRTEASCTIYDSSVYGNIIASGGFIGIVLANGKDIDLSCCSFFAESDCLNGIFIGDQSSYCKIDIINSYYSNFYDNLGTPLKAGSYASMGTISNVQACEPPNREVVIPGLSGNDKIIVMQIGVNSSEHSRLNLAISFELDKFSALRNIGLNKEFDYLSILDNMINTVNAKKVEFGTMQNRLESALDEIAIQYDNLVSSRSTLRDADIAEVSSTYVQQQILQQASATLMATANQSPAIALQLI